MILTWGPDDPHLGPDDPYLGSDCTFLGPEDPYLGLNNPYLGNKLPLTGDQVILTWGSHDHQLFNFIDIYSKSIIVLTDKVRLLETSVFLDLHSLGPLLMAPRVPPKPHPTPS